MRSFMSTTDNSLVTVMLLLTPHLHLILQLPAPGDLVSHFLTPHGILHRSHWHMLRLPGSYQ